MSSSEHNYQAVGASETTRFKEYRMEEGNKIRLYLTAVLVNVASVAVGTAIGWTSPVSPKLNDEELTDTPLSSVPDAQELSWIGALVPLGALIAPFVAGPLADKIGRKWTLLSSTVFFALGSILFLTAGSVGQLYAARLIQGFGVGFVMTAQPMYIGEIATDDTRDTLGSFMQLFIVMGILYVYAIGPFVSYYALQYACLAVQAAFAVGFFFMPESPYYYIGKGKKKEATEALKFLRGKSGEGVQDELTDIQVSVEESMRNTASPLDLVRSKGNLKALITSAGLILFQQLSGINVVLFYTQDIFKDTGSDLKPEIATIIIGIVQVVASGLTPIVVKKLGKRIMLLVSAAAMCLSMGLMGLYFYLKENDPETAKSISWLPIAALVIYIILYCLGFGPLPWAVLGEMFPSNVKSYASSLVASTCWVMGFLITLFYSTLVVAIGSAWSFWLFTICCGVAIPFTFINVFETKGMSLQQIQDKLNGK
ncbi:hypothetical protein HA402_002575 [Bradysia odoriphaga]|nr:hypothetical protein HA402_002575 [Bradysia odoriphaga]